MSLDKFTIQIPDAALADLQQRLAGTRWPDEIESAGWDYGSNLEYMRSLARYWRDGYDWRREEVALNELPQYRVALDGTRIHFVHVRGRGPKPMPLIMTHGWPGSFVEMRKILPLLTDPAAHGGQAEDAFDVVVPSLPGYGFSDRPATRGMEPQTIARLWAQLMEQLGYARFGAQGGDWGSAVSIALGLGHAERLIGIHLNYISGRLLLEGVADAPAGDPLLREFQSQVKNWLEAEGGYSHEQGTKPQTLGYGLNDSPVGLAAWIVEKFRTWSDCGGNVESVFTRDELLTNVSLYWLTATITSSMRLYYESRRQSLNLATKRVKSPVGVAVFPKEIPMPSRALSERMLNVVRWTEMPQGGHFAAMEQPRLLAEDVRAFFRNLR